MRVIPSIPDAGTRASLALRTNTKVATRISSIWLVCERSISSNLTLPVPTRGMKITMEKNSFAKPDADIQWFPCSRNALGTPTDQLHQNPAVPRRPPSPFVPPPPCQHSLPVMLQCLSSALQVLQQTNENCRLMSSIAGFSAEWEAHYNDHFAENHARLQAECQHLLAQQHAIIESSTSPVNAVHPVDQLDAKHHSTEALPMQKGRKVYTKDDEDTVHDRRELPSINTNVANRVEADAPTDVTEACEDPWPDANIPGLASPSTTFGTSSSSTNGCNDVINTGSLTIELPHVSSQLHKPVSSHHLRNFNSSPASVPKHANLFCNDQLIYAVFQVLVAFGTSSAPRTTPSHRPRLRPRTRWKLDNASFVAPIIITGRNGPHHRSWSITSSLFLDARVVC